MEHNACILSICMPTYNRANKAYNQLKFLLEETSDIDDVEIIVANNASEDDTEERLLSLKTLRHFFYIRNSSNIGIIKNINLLVKQALGKYIWIIGDDDSFLPGIVAKVHALLEENEQISGIYINTSRPEKKLELRNDLSAKAACTRLLPIIKGGFLFISGNVIKADAMKRLYQLVDEDIEEALSVPMLSQFVAAQDTNALFEVIRQQTIIDDPQNISWKSHQYKVAVRYNTAIFFYLERFGYSKREAKYIAKRYYIAENRRIFLEMLKHLRKGPTMVLSDFCWYLKSFPITTIILVLTLPFRSIAYLTWKKMGSKHE